MTKANYFKLGIFVIAGIAAGIALLAVALEDRDAPSALRAIERGAQSHDPRSDDGDMLRHLNVCPSRTGRARREAACSPR